MMDLRLAVVSIFAEDVAATTHFYRNVIGLRLLPHHGERPHFDLGGIYLTIVKGRPISAQTPTPRGFPIVAFAVGDLDAAVERLCAHYVELPWGVEEGTDSRWVMFHDPAGNLIELVQFKPAAAHQS